MKTIALLMALLGLFVLAVPTVSNAQRRGNHPGYRHRSPGRINVYVRPGGWYGSGYGYRGNSYSYSVHRYSPCFPFGCGGIEGPFRNPDPERYRKPENLTACMYDAQGTLFYEREGKVCPYKFESIPNAPSSNIERVEKRRQEWLRKQKLQGSPGD